MVMTRHSDIDASKLEPIASGEGSLSQRVYLSLRQAIISLDFLPGATLRMAAICERLGVSRAPVSEAMGKLASEGLVDIVAQSGTRVSYLSVADLREASFIRTALEVASVEQLTEGLDQGVEKRLLRNLRMQEFLAEDGDMQGFYEADEEFHAILLDGTGYDKLANMAQSVSLQISRARLILLPSPGRTSETLNEHRAIFKAVTSGDKKAARDRMQFHLEQLMPQLYALEATRPELFNVAPARASAD